MSRLIAPNGICKQCRLPARLCKSHILPEFVYRDFYDEQHTYAEFSGTADVRNRKHRKGIWERILCTGCERRFQSYEDYACNLIFNNLSVSFPMSDGGIVFHNIDYPKLKSFQLSLLWRAGVSSQPMFRHVKLGPYEEQLRQRLLSCSAVPPGDFPCTMQAIVDRGSHLKGLMMEVVPLKIDRDRSTLYPFVFGGYYCVFLVRTGIRELPPDVSLTENQLRVGQIDVSQIPALFDLFVRVHKQGKFRDFKHTTQRNRT